MSPDDGNTYDRRAVPHVVIIGGGFGGIAAANGTR